MALVVEDDAFQRANVTDLLRHCGMDVIECDSAEAGELVLARAGLELSLLVTDVELGGTMDGLDLAGFARQRFPKIRIVIVSGQSDLAIPAGAAFVRKPFRSEELVKASLPPT